MPLVQTIDNGWHLSRVFKECGRADAFSREALAELRADESRDADDPSDIEAAVHDAMSYDHFVISVGGGNWLVSA